MLVGTETHNKLVIRSHVQNRKISEMSNFTRQQRSFTSVFVDKCFINKVQFDAGFAQGLRFKYGMVPSIKYPGHDSERPVNFR